MDTETREALELIRCDLRSIKEWQDKHENNHHGKMSQLRDHVPWTVVAFIGYAAFELAKKM